MNNIARLLRYPLHLATRLRRIYNLDGLKGWERQFRHWRKSRRYSSPSQTLASEYASQILALPHAGKWGCVPKAQTDFDLTPDDVRLIAFYLPQFHPIPENDAWWGQGFTEWTNVTRAVPQYLGHYQPRLPGDLGFYDLRNTQAQEAQVALAKKYGLSGFCYYHYWFSGRRILETPLNRMLANRSLDMPFCICWANGNWTRAWDGSEREVLLQQTHSPADDIAFFESLLPAFADPRYIRINGRPLLMVYWPSLLNDPAASVERWRTCARANGIADPYLLFPLSHDSMDPRKIGFDAVVEFPPVKKIDKALSLSTVQIANPDFQGQVHDYRQRVRAAESFHAPNYRIFRGIMPSWDNEPRRPGRGISFTHATPELYQRWLLGLCRETKERLVPGERFVFVNAWNEWAEGAYLEPDRRYGYAFLQATADALRLSREPSGNLNGMTVNRNESACDTAIALCVDSCEIWDHIFSSLSRTADVWDLIVAVPAQDVHLQESIRRDKPGAQLVLMGSGTGSTTAFLDLYPFILQRGYKYACKISNISSISSQAEVGVLRQKLELFLGSSARIAQIKAAFDAKPDLGILTELNGPLALHPAWADTMGMVIRLACSLGVPVNPTRDYYPTGTMFWFKPDALKALVRLNLTHEDMSTTSVCDGATLACAIEIALLLAAEAAGYHGEDIFKCV